LLTKEAYGVRLRRLTVYAFYASPSLRPFALAVPDAGR
jgi:hypothetical protein